MVYSHVNDIPQNCIAHRPHVLRTILALLVRAHERVHIQNTYKMVAFAKRLGLERQILVFIRKRVPDPRILLLIYFDCSDHLSKQ